MDARYRLRQVVNVVNLSTPLGLLFGLAGGRGGFRRGPDGLILVDGYRLPVPSAPAFTMGNVILFRDVRCLERRPRLLGHEGRHATQYAWCLGVGMLIPYFASALFSMAWCGDHASYNPFERRADLAAGGYTPRPPRYRRRTRGVR